MHNKKALRIFLALASAAVVTIGMTACGGSPEDEVGNGAIPDSEVVSSDTESSESDGDLSFVLENVDADGVLVYENFASGSLSKHNKIFLDISSIEMTEQGLEIHYKTGGAHDGYEKFYEMENVVLNGCEVNVKYLAGDVEQEYMGRNNTGDTTLPVYVLIPQSELDVYGITAWDSLEFTFDAGYIAYSSINSEYTQEFRLFAGEKHDIAPYDISKNENAVKLVDDSACSAYIINTAWGGTTGGRRIYTIQFENRTGKDVNFNFDKIVVDGEEVDFGINDQDRENWWIDANGSTRADLYWIKYNSMDPDLSKGAEFTVHYEIDGETYAQYVESIPQA